MMQMNFLQIGGFFGVRRLFMNALEDERTRQGVFVSSSRRVGKLPKADWSVHQGG